MKSDSILHPLIHAGALFFASGLITIASAHQPGRMTGGGSIACNGLRVTHGFELHCKREGVPVAEPNNLEINFDGNSFHLLALDTAICTNNPNIDEAPPIAGFDTLRGTGTGVFNPKGPEEPKIVEIAFTLTDAGEPGAFDTATYQIGKDGSILTCGPKVLNRGNHQAHRATGTKP